MLQAAAATKKRGDSGHAAAAAGAAAAGAAAAAAPSRALKDCVDISNSSSGDGVSSMTRRPAAFRQAERERRTPRAAEEEEERDDCGVGARIIVASRTGVSRRRRRNRCVPLESWRPARRGAPVGTPGATPGTAPRTTAERAAVTSSRIRRPAQSHRPESRSGGAVVGALCGSDLRLIPDIGGERCLGSDVARRGVRPPGDGHKRSTLVVVFFFSSSGY
ncbi:unnamed protein product [Lampetra planeri]